MNSNVTLAMPSCRPEQAAEFFRSWRGKGGWDRVVLMEDAETISAAMFDAAGKSDVDVKVICHHDVGQELGDDAWIVSCEDSACRCWAIFKAWRDGAEWVLTLDDDVRPTRQQALLPLADHHIMAMKFRPFFQSSVYGLSPRGMPSQVGQFRTDIRASMGLWEGVPDLYAADMLDGYDRDYKPPLGTRLIPDGEFVPVCGMNLCLHRDAVPLAYFCPQGKGQPYSRYDDIWMGLVLKRGLDLLGWKLSVGEPHIFHSRASDPVKCAAKEAPGRGDVNDRYWQLVSALGSSGGWPNASTVADMIGGYLVSAGHKRGDMYLDTWGKALGIWSRLFEEGKR